MRAGAYTVHQSLTAEAAAVVKLSLSLARRRGHAQVTPLHVAFTLLSSSSLSPLFTFSSSPAAASPSSYAYGLLKRACIKSQPTVAVAHPLQCRALELCFNVALNRLPTGGPHCSPPSSSSSSTTTTSSKSSTSFSASLMLPNPTLSNALVAALKRAQANQRRGCIELQSQQQPPPPPPSLQQQHQKSQPQQEQPLLAIKVELDQLILSILDDPSVSRVMREAGFSSATVKSNLEEESAMLLGLGLGQHTSSSPASPIPPQFFLEPYMDFSVHANGGGCGGTWPSQFLNQPSIGSSFKEDDVRAILEVMMRKQGKKTNPVVVGDSVSVTEGSVAELVRRLERDNVPEELRSLRMLKLRFSYVHVRFMSRTDVDAQVAELRRSVAAASSGRGGDGLVVFVGDLHWAVDEEDAVVTEYSPVEHLATELARLLGEARAAARGRAWLVAAASYQTYIRCRRRRPSLEALWALQAVVVPAGGGTCLALGLQSPPREAEARTSKLGQRQSPLELVEPAMASASTEEVHSLVLCSECSTNYEAEASAVKSQGNNAALGHFTGWQPEAAAHKDYLMELKRKWSRLCQSLHSHIHPSYASSDPWWSLFLPTNHQTKPPIDQPKPSSTARLCLSSETSTDHGTSKNQEVETTLALGSLPASDSTTTSEGRRCRSSEGMDEPATQESNATSGCGSGNVISLRLWREEPSLSGHLKRKAEAVRLPLREPKRPRNGGLDLNLCADEEHGDGDANEEENVPSGITNEGDRHDSLQDDTGFHICARLLQVFEGKAGELEIDEEAVEALTAAASSGCLVDEVFERWVSEVFELAVASVGNGGKVRLGLWGGLEGGGVVLPAFMDSVLPNRIHLV